MKTLAACETNAGDWSQVAVLRPHRTEVLRECVHSSVTDYLRQMDGHEVHDCTASSWRRSSDPS